MASIHSAHDGLSPASPQLVAKVGARELQLAVCEASGERGAVRSPVTPSAPKAIPAFTTRIHHTAQ